MTGQKYHFLLKHLILFILLISLCGCSNNRQSSSISENQKIKIGFSMATLMEDRWIQDFEFFQGVAQQRNMEVIIQNANRDSDLQYEQVCDMLDSGIDVLVIAPNDSDMEARCVSKAKSQDVPVVMYDRFIHNSNADVYVSFDNHKVGQLMAEYLLKHVPTGGYLLVNGPKSDNNSMMIRDGYIEVLQPHIDNGSITILDETWTDGWVREKAYDFVSEKIQGYSEEDISAIICENDSLAWGVTDALTEKGLSQHVEVVGMDADLSACQRIVKGKQGMTVYKPIKMLVDKTINICEQLAAGEEISTEKTLYNIPYVTIDVELVTKETLDETVILDGFHLKDEVYGTD